MFSGNPSGHAGNYPYGLLIKQRMYVFQHLNIGDGTVFFNGELNQYTTLYAVSESIGGIFHVACDKFLKSLSTSRELRCIRYDQRDLICFIKNETSYLAVSTEDFKLHRFIPVGMYQDTVCRIADADGKITVFIGQCMVHNLAGVVKFIHIDTFEGFIFILIQSMDESGYTITCRYRQLT